MHPWQRRLTAVLSSLALGAAALVATAAPASAACSANNVKVIGMHGTGASGWDGISRTRDAIEARTSYATTTKAITWSNSVAIAGAYYPAALDDGEEQLTKYIEGQYDACRSTKYVLVGYSMGAHVIGNLLDPFGHQLSSGLKGQIKAVVLYGDPSFTRNSFDRGTFNKYDVGRLARAPFELDPWSSKLASWCDGNDLWCQSGFSLAVHEGYDAKYASAAGSFVRGRLGK